MLLLISICDTKSLCELETRCSTKHAFERFAAEHGVKIHAYRADNAPFGAKEFTDDLARGIKILRIQEPVLIIRMEWPNERSRR